MSVPAIGQSATEGRDFWVLFLHNGGTEHPDELKLTAIGDTACTLSVAHPLTGWSASEALAAGTSTSVDLPASVIPERAIGARLDSTALHVTATASVTLLASYEQLASTAVALVLPTAALRSHYVVIDYPADPERSAATGATVGFVAVEDNTVLSMTLPCAIPGHAAGSTLSVTLQAGQTYRLMTNVANQSFSGMEVTANKSFAMFQGNELCGPPFGGSGDSGDHLYGQAIPVEYWGCDYALVSSRNRSVGDRVRIVAAESCTITVTGGQTYTLMPGECKELALPTTAAWMLHSTRPVGVALVMCNSNWNGEPGDAALTELPPLDRGVSHALFTTFTTQRIHTWSLNIVVSTADVGSMTLDGAPIATTLFTAIDTAYSYVRLAIGAGTHRLACSQGTFVAWTYGVGNVEAYSYTSGFRTEPPSEAVHDTSEYRDTVCQNEDYQGFGFSIGRTETIYSGTLERWRSETVGDTIRHHHLLLTVLPLSYGDTAAYLILGDTLFFLGDTLTQAATYHYALTAANGCDSLLTLYLNWEEIHLTASAEGLCPGDSTTITAHGTHLAYWTSSPPDPGLAAQQGQPVITVSPAQTTQYTLLSDSNGSILQSIVIGVDPPPELCVEVSRPFIDFDFPVVYLTDCSEGSASSTWTFSDGITLNIGKARRQFRHPLPDSVEVTLRSCNRWNCCVDTTFILRSLTRSVWFPNVFTPGEETNNRFGVTASFEIVDFELYIYNRQGLLIYKTTDPAATWDGTRDGRPCQQGTYAYYWHVRDAFDYNQSGAGTVTLIR